MKLAVVGTGYVGLVAGTCFAESGNDVICVDIDEKKIDMLNAGKVPIYEPGLEEMVRRNAAEQRLSFTTDLAAAVKKSDDYFHRRGHAPGTDRPRQSRIRQGDGQGHRQSDGCLQDHRHQKHRAGGHRGSDQAMDQPKRPQQPFAVVSNPEFMKEGAAVEDFMKPDRVVLGGDNAEALEAAARNSTSLSCAPAIRS